MTLMEAYRKASSLCDRRLVECAVNSKSWRFSPSGTFWFLDPIIISRETGEILSKEETQKYQDGNEPTVYEIMPDGTFVRFEVADKVRLTRELVFTSFIDDDEKLALPPGTEVWVADESVHFLEYFSEDWLEKELYPYQYTYGFGDIEPVKYRRDREGLTFCPLFHCLIDNMDCFRIMEEADGTMTEGTVSDGSGEQDEWKERCRKCRFHDMEPIV